MAKAKKAVKKSAAAKKSAVKKAAPKKAAAKKAAPKSSPKKKATKAIVKKVVQLMLPAQDPNAPFFLEKRGSKFFCMQRGATHNIEHAGFFKEERAKFHMLDMHGIVV